MAARRRLTAEDWTTAALTALASGGLAAVAVEPIAAGLETTKGSFYWHFANRDALLEATLQRWERTETEEVIVQVEQLPAGTARLRWLFTAAVRHEHAVSTGARVELALQPTAAHPLVAPVLARVTRRRLDYLAEQFTALEFDPDEAYRRGVLAYTAYLGHLQLAHATPAASPADLPAYIDTVMSVLVS